MQFKEQKKNLKNIIVAIYKIELDCKVEECSQMFIININEIITINYDNRVDSKIVCVDTK